MREARRTSTRLVYCGMHIGKYSLEGAPRRSWSLLVNGVPTNHDQEERRGEVRGLYLL